MSKWILLVFGSGLVGIVSAAELYQWTDADGVIHFGDRPPAGGGAEERAVVVPERIGTVAPEAAPVRAPVKRSRRTARPSGAALQAERRKRAEKCHRARQQRRAVAAKLRVGYRASQYRSLRQREERARADIRFYCD